MRAAVYHGRGDVRIEDVMAPPEQLRAEDVLIRPLYVGICGSDIHEYADGPDLMPVDPVTGTAVPAILGHELSAEVVAIGSAVGGIAPGDLVAVRPGLWCGRCRTCLSGYPTSCPSFTALGLGYRWGGLAEYALVAGDQLTVMPEGVTAQQAALLEPLGVASVAVDHARVRPGGSLLITGAGPIGALAALYAATGGVERIIVSEPSPARRAFITGLGVAKAVHPDEAERLAQDVDGTVEASGTAAGLSSCIRAIRPGGAVVQVGLHGKDPVVPVTLLNFKQATLVGSWCWPVESWLPNARLVASGRLPVEKLITAVVGLDGLVADGLEALRDPLAEHQKILIRVADAAG